MFLFLFPFWQDFCRFRFGVDLITVMYVCEGMNVFFFHSPHSHISRGISGQDWRYGEGRCNKREKMNFLPRNWPCILWRYLWFMRMTNCNDLCGTKCGASILSQSLIWRQGQSSKENKYEWSGNERKSMKILSSTNCNIRLRAREMELSQSRTYHNFLSVACCVWRQRDEAMTRIFISIPQYGSSKLILIDDDHSTQTFTVNNGRRLSIPDRKQARESAVGGNII